MDGCMDWTGLDCINWIIKRDTERERERTRKRKNENEKEGNNEKRADHA
jgi:hypothetical protein